MSPQITELVGYTPEEWIDDSSLWLHLVHPDDRLRVSQANQQTNDTGDPFVLEYRMFGRDGRLVWVRDEAILVRDESDTPRFWQGVMIDITHRKVAEEALRETNEALSALIESSPLAIVSLDLRGRVMLWNPAAERLFGSAARGGDRAARSARFARPGSDLRRDHPERQPGRSGNGRRGAVPHARW